MSAQTQTATLTGTVKSEAGDPLENANVLITDMAISVATNAAGRYTIVIPAERVRGQTVALTARSIGYKAVSKPVTLSGGTVNNDFSLARDINRLSDLVVTGVSGATEQKKLAFTVASVSAEDMPVPGSNPLTQLQGKVAGANIVSGNGRPGSAPAIILRGPQSLNASGRSQEPLLIIDGTISSGSIQDINPQDIENIEIVKGAAASSIYGSRAGNGVIQITTRSGKNQTEGVKFRAQTEYGVGTLENSYLYPKTHFLLMDPTYTRFCVNVAATQDCSRTVDFAQEVFRVNDGAVDFTLPPVNFTNDGGIALNPGPQRLRSLFQVNRFPLTYNPINQFLTNGATSNTTFDATGKVGRTNFFASINQLRNEGAVKFIPGYRRNSVRLNVDQQLPSNISFSIRTTFNDIIDYNNGSAFFSLTRQPASANLLARDTKGRLNYRTVIQGQGSQNTNPAYNSENFQPVNKISRFLGSATARWQPLTWLDGEVNFGYDGRQNFQESQVDKGFLTTGTTQNLGTINRSANRGYALNSSLSVTARRSFFGDALNTRTNFRATYEGTDDRNQALQGTNLVVPGLADPDAAITGQTIGGGTETTKQVGYVLEFAPDYKGRYITSFSIRRDAASLFGAAERWATYMRGSLAWRLSDEPWFQQNFFSDLKFRASVGQAGNRPRYNAQYETFNIGAGGSLSPQALGNKNLKPEVTTETEIGVDMEIKNRYQLTVTNALNVIDQQLLPVVPPASAGVATQWQNAGELTNKTWEVSLNIPIILRRNLNYQMRVSADRTTSTISRLDIPERTLAGGGQQGAETMFNLKQGQRFDAMFGRKFIKDCKDMPADFIAKCGPGQEFQANSDGYVVWVGQGNTPNDGITKNLWMTLLPAANAPYGGGINKFPLAWGMPMIQRDAAGNKMRQVIGQALPDFKWATAHTVTYKRFSAYGLLDAVVGKDVWNVGRQWSFGDFMNADADNAGRTVETAKPMGYYFRAENTGGIGGLYDELGLNNNTVEDASYVKLRELNVGYRIGSIAGIGNWQVSIIGRNLKTFTNYRGFDPEVGIGGGTINSAVLNAVDGFVFPNMRQFTFSLSTSF